MDWTLTVRWL